MSKFTKVLAVCSALTMIAPVAFGATVEELQAQINALLAQIQALQAQLAAAQGGASTTTFTSNLTVGSKGAEVTALQNLLISANKGPKAAALAAVGATGYFGPLTKAALAEYQAAVGISPASGYFGPITRAYVNSLATTTGTGTSTATTTTTTTQGTEGSFTATLSASPANNANANTGTNIPVYGIDIKATGSDIKIDRVDLQLAVTSGGVTYNPASFITKISAYDGSTKLVEKAISASDIEQDDNNVYWTRLSGVNFNVPKGTTKTLTIDIDTISAIDNPRTVTINVYGAQGIRGTDTLGLNSYAALATQRQHVFTAGGASQLTITLSPSSPLVSNVLVDGTNGATDVPMLAFDAKATIDNAVIKTIAVRQTYGSRTANTIKIYDGNTLVASGVASGVGETTGVTTFSNLAISVPKDQTKTLVVKVDYPAGYGLGEVASVSLDKDAAVVYQRADGITANATIAADIQGSGQHLYRKAPVITLAATPSITYTPATDNASGTVHAIIALKFTPKGGSMVAPSLESTTIGFATSGATISESVASSTFSISYSPATTIYADGNYPENTDVTVTYEGWLNGVDPRSAGTQVVKMVITQLRWKMVGQNEVTQDWGLDNFVTNYAGPVKVLPY